MRIIPLILLIGFLIEVAAFVLVASWIGVLPAIGLALLTSLIGGVLLRIQGLSTISRIQRVIEAGQTPARELVDGLMIVLAGMLLMLPGFLSDLLGILLFVPGIRSAVWSFLKARITIITRPFGRTRDEDRVIDLDSSDYRHTPDPGSPWRRLDKD